MKKNIIVILRVLLCAIIMFMAMSCAAPAAEKKTDVNPPIEKGVSEDKTDKRIYFAGPMFSQGEKDFNLKLVKVLEDHGYEVFLPQRDGIEAALLEGKTAEEKLKIIFEKDVNEITKADILVMLIDGRVPDEGACIELGIAYAQGKRCYGLKTDTRTIQLDLDNNPMIEGCFIRYFKNYSGDKLIEELEQYLSENDL